MTRRRNPGVACEECSRAARAGERWRNSDVCDDCAYDSETLRIGTPAEKAAAKKALRARRESEGQRRRGNPTRRRRRNSYDFSQPEPSWGKALATTNDDRRLLMMALGCAMGELRGGKLTAGEREFLARLQEMYERIADL